jgi:hypothetical protein
MAKAESKDTPESTLYRNNPVPTGYGLRDFVAFLVRAARGNQRLTAEEHKKLRQHGRVLSDVVKELAGVLTEGQPGHVQEYRRGRLWQALGSAALIANYQTKNPVVTRQELECAARGTREIKAQSHRTDQTIMDLATPYWREHPDRKSWTVAGAILVELNRQFKAEGLRPLKQHAVRTRLDKLRPYIT